ncbi:MAG: thermonuclease [Rhodocyclaceae bacterium]|nr:thermonuclease [Rhodocyclaceae bacterium]
MRSGFPGLLVLVALVWLGFGGDLPANPSSSPTVAAPGAVERVVDGDTLRVVLDNGDMRTLRLKGVDAPESGQQGGPEAGEFVAARVCAGRVAWLLHGEDRYGRSVASVEVDGEDLGLLLVRAGMAWPIRRYLEGLPADVVAAYDAAWRQARATRVGIWAGDPEPPWQWRRTHRPSSGHAIRCADRR